MQYQGHRASRTWLTGKVNPKRPVGTPLGYVVQRRSGGGWHTLVTTQFPIETDGLAHVFFLTNKPGLCRVRVTYQGDPDLVRAASSWKEFRAHSPH